MFAISSSVQKIAEKDLMKNNKLVTFNMHMFKFLGSSMFNQLYIKYLLNIFQFISDPISI